MNNIFENAYFGKAYRTRDGKKAIYLGNCIDLHFLMVETSVVIRNYLEDGHETIFEHMPMDSPYNIVSEWQEPIDEEKLDELAKRNNIYDRFADDFECENYYGFIEGFKIGYRKAKEK